MNKIRLVVNLVVFCLVIGSLSVIFAVTPDNEISVSERRPLLTMEDVKSSDKHIFEELESYLLDQFPFRDTFRSIKAFLYTDVFSKNDNNGIYKHNGTVVKIEDELDEEQIKYLTQLTNKVISRYFSDDKIYYSIVPDKHFYASKENGYPAMDYDKMFDIMSENLTGVKYIDITDKLSLADYYTTDSHWSQDKIDDVAQHIVNEMNPGTSIIPEEGWTVKTLSPFYGVYYGQSALSLPPDEIKYLTSKNTNELVMYVIDDRGKKNQYPVYVTEMFKNKDPYDMFAAGAQHLVIVENPNATNDKELVVFRDSFGSSIAPLLSLGYKKVTFVDLRYIVPDFIKQISGFGNDVDVLFLYSTGLINGGRILKDFQR